MEEIDKITIRPLATVDEREACLGLQRATWGEGFTEAVPPSLMLVSEKLGGVAAGAFLPSGELVGFVFGLTGARDGELVHWSDMLAVRPPWRNRGLGRRLKEYQRQRVLAVGVEKMYWSFDPLEAKNAYFNIIRLGVRVEEYVRNMYGSGEASRLHRGLGTDRFVVVWDLAEEASGMETNRAEDQTHRADAPNVSASELDGRPRPRADLDATTEVLRLEIPSDIQHVKQHDPDLAVQWRKVTRHAFEHYLDRGYAVISFVRDAATGRCHYLLLHESADR